MNEPIVITGHEGKTISLDVNYEYTGVTAMKATPMSLGDYNQFCGRELPKNENPHKAGYLIRYSDGHIIWSPLAVFESQWRKVDA